MNLYTSNEWLPIGSDMEPSTAIQSRQIGAILVEKNLISDAQLERALQLQESTGQRLDQIVISEFGVSELELANAELRIAPGPTRPMQPIEQLTPASVQIRRPIGEIFVELGFINGDQLEAALTVQRRTGARIGEILVEQGSLTRLDLASALAEHWEPRPSASGAEGQPSQNGVRVAAPTDQEWSAENFAAVAELEVRLRVAEERLEAGSLAPRRRSLRRRSSATGDHALNARVDDMAARLHGLGAVEGSIADLRTSLERLDAVRVGDALAMGARFAGLQATVDRLAELEAHVQERVDRKLADLAEALAGSAAELRVELEALTDRSAIADPGERLLDLSRRIDSTTREGHDRIGGLAEELNRRIEDIVGLTGGLVGRDEAMEAVQADLEARTTGLDSQLQAQRDETATLRARVEELQETAARGTASEERLESMLEQRLEGLTGRLTDEIVGARMEAEEAIAALRGETGSLAARIDELLGLRHADAQAARAASEELGERLEALAALRADDLEAARAAAQASEVERGLHAELERVASSVEELGRRLEAQAAIGEERVRVTERALRKGLASLGKRLTGPGSKYAEPGKGLGRSIERLGAAVVEADARMADQIPVSEAEGCVAFAPTAEGYRLVELPGTPPEIGSTVELDASDGPLLVTRYGRSPLPLDGRPCAYLDRA